MRIHEIIDSIPESSDEVYVCHAPDGQCRILSRDGNLYDQYGQLSQAKAIVFDAHWRGANALEVAAHWPKPPMKAAATASDAPRSSYFGGPSLDHGVE